MNQQQLEKLWEALAEYGIHNEDDLLNVAKTIKPIRITCLVHRPINEKKAQNEFSENKRV